VGGCGAAAHVPIHCLPLGVSAIGSIGSSPMRAQVTVFATSLFKGSTFAEMSHWDQYI
jgi:hypothetical protein